MDRTAFHIREALENVDQAIEESMWGDGKTDDIDRELGIDRN